MIDEADEPKGGNQIPQWEIPSVNLSCPKICIGKLLGRLHTKYAGEVEPDASEVKQRFANPGVLPIDYAADFFSLPEDISIPKVPMQENRLILGY
jgi:hypothetical protein